MNSTTLFARLAAAILATTCVFAEAEHHESIDGEYVKTVMSQTGPIRVEKLASLRFPWGMDYLPDGDILITEKPGTLRRYAADGTLSYPIGGVPEVAYRNQGGLLDVAVDPNYATNGMIYLYFVEAAGRQPADPVLDADPRLGPYIDEQDKVLKGGAVARAVLDGDQLEQVTVIWRQTPKTIGLGHFGGRLVFDPDGRLIVTSGERQKFSPAQDPDTNLGKIVRINTDGTIPEDNPYADAVSPRNTVWSSGHRNPLGAAIRPSTDKLYIHEMGPLYGDELNVPEPGRDYGWPTVSNGEHYNRVQIPHHETALEDFARPLFYWRPAISPSGLDFYTGERFAEWSGNALIGGLSSKALIRVVFDGNQVVGDERINLLLRIRDVMTARDGSVLLLTDYEDGALLRLTPGTG